MFNALSSKKTAFGFDLSDISIKIMALEKEGKGYKVSAYTDHQMPRGVVVNDIIMDEAGLISQIQAALRKLDFGKIDSNEVIASIPESKAFVRVIQLPKMTEEQAANAIPFESEQYIPIPIDQVYLDWQIVRDNGEKMDVLVTASPKDYVDSYLAALKKAELRPIAFEVESAACGRALVSNDKKDKAMLIMDMDTYRTSLIVVEDGMLQFTSSVPIAGDAFTQGIAKTLGISEKEAEKTKRTIGLDESKEHQAVRAALSPVVDSLIVEVKNTIKFHNEHSSKPISQIVLCGGSAKLMHLSSYLYQQLTEYDQIDIVLGNPWVNIFDVGSKTQAPLNREESLSFTTSIGLAMRGAE